MILQFKGLDTTQSGDQEYQFTKAFFLFSVHFCRCGMWGGGGHSLGYCPGLKGGSEDRKTEQEGREGKSIGDKTLTGTRTKFS